MAATAVESVIATESVTAAVKPSSSMKFAATKASTSKAFMFKSSASKAVMIDAGSQKSQDPQLTHSPRRARRDFSPYPFAGRPNRCEHFSMSSSVTGPRLDPLKPIHTAHLFPKIDGMLLELLRSLSPDDWERQTVSPKWKVKDVAAHLLDTALRGVSIGRDGYVLPAPRIDSPDALATCIDRLNAEGVAVYRRLSPAILISLMETACKQLAEYHAARDPYAPATYGVSWAGEEKSANWFDTAREFTERWHHQQQIRLAVNRPGIMTPELYHPVLDCFVRALPFTYRSVAAKPGTVIQVTVSGDCGGRWNLYREPNGWVLTEDARGQQASEITIPQEIAWRIFTKGIDRESALSQVKITGDSALALPVLGMVSIISV
jgi:uncharacterized protein (TIGR03083 family)